VEPNGIWLYAITERVDLTPPAQIKGVGGRQVRTVAAAGLAAVVEDVGLAEFGEEALRRNLEDLDWLETTARAHHGVINAVAQQGPLVPMRLATVYSDDARIAAMLNERRADFRSALRRISGRLEWGVKAYADRHPEASDDSAATAGTSGPGGGVGAAYLQRRRSQLAAQKNARRETLASAEMIHAELSQYAVETRVHAPQAPQLTGIKAPMILNAAYLLDSARGEDFAAAVAAAADQHPGLRLELTGPWPPYSFAGTDGEGGLT
jgi:Gas vesicle synthesis protein GvpL/GvpF